MKKIFLLLIPLLLAGCTNMETKIQEQIDEADKQIAIATEQIKTAESVKASNERVKKAAQSYLEALQGNVPPSNGTSKIKQNTTIAPSVGGYICIVSDQGETEYHEYKDNEVEYLQDCGAFAGRNDCWVTTDGANCLKKE